MLAYIRKLTETNDDGASAVEYGLLIAAIAALIVIVVFALGGLVKNVFSSTCEGIVSGASPNSAITASCDS